MRRTNGIASAPARMAAATDRQNEELLKNGVARSSTMATAMGMPECLSARIVEEQESGASRTT